jgi:hypothetical protein
MARIRLVTSKAVVGAIPDRGTADLKLGPAQL